MLLFTSAILCMFLSFILREIIILRLISAILLVACAYSLYQPWLFVGWTSGNVDPYYGGTAGDPGHGKEEVYLALSLGLIGALQLFYMIYLVLSLISKSDFGRKPEVAERYF